MQEFEISDAVVGASERPARALRNISRFCVLSILIQSTLPSLCVFTPPYTSHPRTIKLCYVLARFTVNTVWHHFIDIVIGTSYQVGKLNASETRQEWNCNSGCEAPQHCTLPRCTNVVFPQTFSGSGTVSKTWGTGLCNFLLLVGNNKPLKKLNVPNKF